MRCAAFYISPALLRLACVFIGVCGSAVAAEKPNVILVLVDDMGWGDPAVFGGKVPTPNFDRLAREGTQFRQFYVASPICSASRCGLITGQFPARWRITSYLQTRAGNRECEQADFLDPRAPSLPRAFHDAGYATAHIGKWHLGGGRDVVDAPKFADYGYDLGLGTYESPEPVAALGSKSMPWSEQLEPQQVPRHERTRWMVDQTLGFLQAHAGKPCFVNLWFDDVHTPFRPAPGPPGSGKVEAGPKSRASFDAVLAETDRQIGRLLDELRARGQEKNTLVLVAGDNGPEPTFDRVRTGGLRGMKWSLYEGGIRTPLIVRWPRGVPAGAVNDSTIVGAVDFFPTLCQLASVEPPAGIAFDGEDMGAVFRGGKHTRTKPLLWEYGRKPAAKGLRTFPYPGEPEARSPNVAIRDGDWKLLVNADGSRAELFNLRADPNEANDVINAEPAIAARLQSAALEWRAALPKLDPP
jgi:arylsulfatase A-like enzyme